MINTEWIISKEEKAYLRGLATKQAEIAAMPVMEQRKQMWYNLNDGHKNTRPPVIIESGTFNQDFMPESVFQCKNPSARRIESQLLNSIRYHECINDDRVIPDTFNISWNVSIDAMGVKLESEHVSDGLGGNLGHRMIHPIKELARDLHILKPAKCEVDRDKTIAYKTFLEDLLGDILPVTIRSNVYASQNLTQTVIRLMGMEAFMLALYCEPDSVHALMSYLRDNSIKIMSWAESENLFVQNTGNDVAYPSSFNFTHRLDRQNGETGPVKLSEMWGNADSQETVGVSPELYHEFCLPYYVDVCRPVGLIYYGCCEPVHPFWEDIKTIPHLQKVSISKWCNQEFMADALRETDIVYSRKPDPTLLGVEKELDESAWSAHIRETLDITRGVSVEFIIRDVYTMHGNLDKARRAIELARKEIDRLF